MAVAKTPRAKALVLKAVVLAMAATPSLAQPEALSLTEIEAAIKWGIDGEPGPYLIHHAQGPQGINRVVVGAVYTPFVRVALAARALFEQGKTLTAAEVPNGLVLPEAWVAVRWYIDHCPLATTWPVVEAVQPNVLLAGRRGPSGLQPTRTADRDVLIRLGGHPFPDISHVVTYPLDVVRQDLDLIVSNRGGEPLCFERGRIIGAVSRAWR
jgi:hypothetical protein